MEILTGVWPNNVINDPLDQKVIVLMSSRPSAYYDKTTIVVLPVDYLSALFWWSLGDSHIIRLKSSGEKGMGNKDRE